MVAANQVIGEQTHQEFHTELTGDLNVAEKTTAEPIIQYTETDRGFVKDVGDKTEVAIQAQQKNIAEMVKLGLISQELADKAKEGTLSFEEGLQLSRLESFYEEAGLLVESGAIDSRTVVEMFDVLQGVESGS
ncbi:MAG: hypothetical protein Q7S37_01270 [bacterium]|nr:hypothetical protein [bacterium]